MSSKQSNSTIRHFLQLTDLTLDELKYVLKRAQIIKNKFKRYEPHMPLYDRTLAMVFEKASTRTRVSFEAGMYQMGESVNSVRTLIEHAEGLTEEAFTARAV